MRDSDKTAVLVWVFKVRGRQFCLNNLLFTTRLFNLFFCYTNSTQRTDFYKRKVLPVEITIRLYEQEVQYNEA